MGNGNDRYQAINHEMLKYVYKSMNCIEFRANFRLKTVRKNAPANLKNLDKDAVNVNFVAGYDEAKS